MLVAEQVVLGVIRSSEGAIRVPRPARPAHTRDGQIIHARDYMDGLGVANAMARLPAVIAALAK